MNLPIASIRNIRDQLVEAFPEMADDELLLVDMLDGETGAIDWIASLVRKNREDKASVAALKTLIGEYQERASRLDARAKASADAVCKIMEAIGVRKIERPEFTASLRTVPPRPLILDAAALPDRCVTVETVRKPNLDEIKRLLNDGRSVAGATLSNGSETLTVRVR